MRPGVHLESLQGQSPCWRTHLRRCGHWFHCSGLMGKMLRALSQGPWLGSLLPRMCVLTLFLWGSLALPLESWHLIQRGLDTPALVELLRRWLSQGFLLLLVIAYLRRTRPVACARGFAERLFPIFVLVIGFAGHAWLGRSARPQLVSYVLAGLALTLLGYSLSLWALWHLRRAFSIMVEARQSVTSGPYRFVRHPLYLGEILVLLGLGVLSGNDMALLFWVTFVGLQLWRARLEEGKLSHQFPAYRAYRRRTPFILPGLYLQGLRGQRPPAQPEVVRADAPVRAVREPMSSGT